MVDLRLRSPGGERAPQEGTEKGRRLTWKRVGRSLLTKGVESKP
jgi:hypothetical protein